MTAKTVGTALNLGYPGAVAYNGPGHPDIRSYTLNSASANASFGNATYMLTDGTVKAADASFTAAAFCGVVVTDIKTNNSFANINTTDNTSPVYKPGDRLGVLKTGVVPVFLAYGTTVTAGGTVYIRVTSSTANPSPIIGGFESASDGAHNIALTNAKWLDNRVDPVTGVAFLQILTQLN